MKGRRRRKRIRRPRKGSKAGGMEEELRYKINTTALIATDT
jgi:hypothetical protein